MLRVGRDRRDLFLSGLYGHPAGADGNPPGVVFLHDVRELGFPGINAMALIRLRATKPEMPRPYRVWDTPGRR